MFRKKFEEWGKVAGGIHLDHREPADFGIRAAEILEAANETKRPYHGGGQSHGPQVVLAIRAAKALL
jgi:hypothetical protein